MNHMTEVSGLSWHRRLWNAVQNDDRFAAGGAAFLGSMLTAMGRIAGETAPFGVAFSAAAPVLWQRPPCWGRHWAIC